MKIAKAKYTYQFLEQKGHKILSIIDIGGETDRSVTNDIENVVSDIEEMTGINAEDYLIIYQDSEGRWDGWSKERGFISLQSLYRPEAIQRYIKLVAQKHGI